MAAALSAKILESLPPVDEEAADRLLERELLTAPRKIVVLDDDPTGVQTVHGVSVYTSWTEEAVLAGFAEENRVFYILTNSRGMSASESAAVHREIGKNIAAAAEKTGRTFMVMSRSDSTLRGHYPLETDILREAMEADGITADGEILCPFFKEGGRFTIGDVHYVRQGELLVPAADTEFARDRTFGYSHSSIPEYIEEKTGGACRASSVTSVSLDRLRAADFDGITEQLLSVRNYGRVCVNAVDYADLKVFAVSLYRAVRQGKHFLFRTAAGLVRVLGGIPEIPLLKREQMVEPGRGKGGLVVVGSHTQKTTAQLKRLLELEGTVPVAFDSDRVLDGDEALDAEVRRCVAEEERIIREGKTAVCFTRRELLSVGGDTKESALKRSVKISGAVKDLVARLGVRPSFIVAKGGITSSDIGTKALGVRKAVVMGQIIPSVPVWRTGSESRFPGMAYVIFPGNTGDEGSLRQAVMILQGDPGGPEPG